MSERAWPFVPTQPSPGAAVPITDEFAMTELSQTKFGVCGRFGPSALVCVLLKSVGSALAVAGMARSTRTRGRKMRRSLGMCDQTSGKLLERDADLKPSPPGRLGRKSHCAKAAPRVAGRDPGRRPPFVPAACGPDDNCRD